MQQKSDEEWMLGAGPQAAANLRQGRYYEALLIYLDSFDGRDPQIATALGYLYSRRKWAQSDLAKAFEYYTIGAQGGVGYANHALGGLLMRSGRKAEALDQYIAGARRGRMECAYNAWLLLRQFDRAEQALEMQALAAQLGHPIAGRNQAFDLIFGRNGPKNILRGLKQYIRLIPGLVAYANGLSRQASR